MRAHFVATNMPGGRRLRAIWPAKALNDAGFKAFAHDGWPGGLGDEDVVLIHRPLASDLLEALRRYQRAGIRVVVQEDDEMECIPRQNHFQATRQQLQIHRLAITEADAVVVTSDRLQAVYGAWNPHVYQVPNRLPRWVQERAMAPRSSVWVGWAGVIEVHRHDLEWLAPHAERMLAGARFSTVGDGRVLKLLGVSGRAEPWQRDPESFYRAMSWPSIGIVPLDNGENRDFNTSKSWLKSLEFVTLGRPVVATDLPEQRKVIRHGENGFLVGTPEEFAECVQVLVRDAELRVRMTSAARETGKREALEEHLTEWTEMLEAVCSRPVSSAAYRRSRPGVRPTTSRRGTIGSKSDGNGSFEPTSENADGSVLVGGSCRIRPRS